ncbi:MAG: GtrA family protein [Candidatus Sericytochromatia bacterium]|nr:GtrA family protein [Candidatus Tanganyikabacteria bacterium]
MFDTRFLKFLAVGVLNTLFGYSLYALLVFIGLDVALAILLGTILGVLFNFKTTGTLVFGSRDNRRLIRFIGVYALLYVVNVASVKLLMGAGLNSYLAGAVLLAPMAILAFLLNRKLVFAQERP